MSVREPVGCWSPETMASLEWLTCHSLSGVHAAAADNHRALMAQLQGVDLRSAIIHRVERPGKVIYR